MTNGKRETDKKRMGDNAGQTASSDREITVEGDRGKIWQIQHVV